MDKLVGLKMIPQYTTLSECYLTQNNRVLKYTYKTKKLEKVCMASNSKSFIKERLLRNRLYRNYISNNFGINHLCVLKNRHMIMLYDELYYYDLSSNNNKAQRINIYNRLGVAPPLKNGIAIHEKSDCFYFGEYINGDKENVRVVRISKDGSEITVVYTFKAGDIQHIHSVFYDNFRNRLWITTGDSDSECGIYYTDDEFESLIKLGGGDQTWRAVTVIPCENEIIWGMDAGKDATKDAINKIYHYNFLTNKKTEEAVIGNPAYHAAISILGDIYLGINFEPGRKQATKEEAAIWKYTTKKENKWSKIRSFSYANKAVNGCSLYGYVYLPIGIGPPGELLYSVLNCVEREFATYLITE